MLARSQCRRMARVGFWRSPTRWQHIHGLPRSVCNSRSCFEICTRLSLIWLSAIRRFKMTTVSRLSVPSPSTATANAAPVACVLAMYVRSANATWRRWKP